MNQENTEAQNKPKLPREAIDNRIAVLGSDLSEVIDHLESMKKTLSKKQNMDTYFLGEAIVNLIGMQDLAKENNPDEFL